MQLASINKKQLLIIEVFVMTFIFEKQYLEKQPLLATLSFVKMQQITQYI